MRKVGIVKKKVGNFAFALGYNVRESMTCVQIHISRYEVCIRIDVLFVGLYIGWTD